MNTSRWEKMKAFVEGHLKLVFFLSAMAALAVTVPFMVPALRTEFLAVIALCSLTAIGFTFNRFAGVVAAVISVVVCVHYVIDRYQSLQPNVEYAEFFQALEEQNSESAKTYTPGSSLRSAIFGKVMSLEAKVAHAVDKKGLQYVNDQHADSTLLETNVKQDMLDLAGNIRTVQADLEGILDSAGITVPGRTKTLSREFPASTAVWTNAFIIPDGYTVVVSVEHADMATADTAGIGPEGLPEIVTAEEAEMEEYPVVGQRKLAVLVRMTNPESIGDGEIHALANDRLTWTNQSGHDLVVQMVVNCAPSLAPGITGTVRLSAVLRKAPVA